MFSILKEISFVRLTIPFTLGIIGSVFFPLEINFNILLITSFLLLVLFLSLHFFGKLQSSYKLRWLNGVIVFIMFILIGYVLCQSRTQINEKKHFSQFLTEDSRLVVKIIEPITEKANSYKTIAKVKLVINEDYHIQTFGKALIYFKKDSTVHDIKFGDILLIENNFQQLPYPQNPFEFNYQQFMGFRQIYHQCYLAPGSWILTGKNQAFPVYAEILQLRQYLFNLLQHHIKDENSLAVASSLVLGLREKLDDDIIQAYSSSGAMHVLAVSGLHVGIIYIIINSILFFLNRSQKTKIIKSILIVLVIWLYACLTGLSPSVLRAAIMFSFIAAAATFRRSTNIYNVLACSAFLLLLFNPYLIMEVGFQLSYAAVVGIVMIQPKIYNLLYTSNRVLDKIWMITSVSIAAQIATFPIGLLYFHQFPTYFFVSNLFVIPAAMLILYLGISLFLFSWIGWLSTFIGAILNILILYLNKVIFFIESLPYSLMQGLAISIFESWLIYIFIGGIIAFVYLSRIRFLQLALTSIILFFVLNVFESFSQLHQQKIIVYNISNHSAIDFIYGKQNQLIADKTLLTDESKMLFHIKHFWWESGIKKGNTSTSKNIQNSFLASYKNYFQFCDKRIGILEEPVTGKANIKLDLDILILSNDPKIKMKDLKEQYTFDQLVFDSSNSYRRTNYWKKECEELGIAYYDVREKGAFILNI